MELENHEEIIKIDNCPSINENGIIKLFRFVENNPIEETDLVPHAILHPHLSNNCLAWGLSFFKSKEASLNVINGLNIKRKRKIIGIASIDTDDKIAIKHQSGVNNYHYTVYPFKNVNFIDKFTTEKI